MLIGLKSCGIYTHFGNGTYNSQVLIHRGDHFTWIMPPELASALIETEVVLPETDGLALVPDVDIHASSFSAVEGRAKLVLHLVRERNRELVSAKNCLLYTSDAADE